MSFILDALRKAEHERNLGQPPDLHEIPRTTTLLPAYGSRQYRVLRMTLLTALVIACVTTLAVLHYRHATTGSALETSVKAPVHAAMTVRAKLTTSVAPDDGFARADSPLSADDTVGEDNPGITTLDDLAGDSSADDESISGDAVLPAQSTPTGTTQSEAESTPTSATDNTPYAATQSPARLIENGKQLALTLDDHLSGHIQTSPMPAADAVQQLTLASASTPAVLPLKDMPAEYRESFPSLTVDVHAYDPQPKKRFVMINGHNYREGDTLAEGPRIVSIVSNGIVFDYHGQQVLFAIGAH
ncbi:MAG: general secretion pathway protein GspB [Stenotrophobium sp.]